MPLSGSDSCGRARHSQGNSEESGVEVMTSYAVVYESGPNDLAARAARGYRARTHIWILAKAFGKPAFSRLPARPSPSLWKNCSAKSDPKVRAQCLCWPRRSTTA
jgi:hypothetical protein